MKGILDWLKSNVLIVVFVVLMIAFPVGGFIGSSMWNAKIKAKIENEYATDKQSLDRAEMVNYAIPQIDPSEAPLEYRRAPNDAVTDFLVQKRDERAAVVDSVLSSATELNAGGLTKVVPSLLPPPEDERQARDAARGSADAFAAAYASLFGERVLNAGPNPSAVDVAKLVAEEAERWRDGQGLGPSDSLSEEQRETLRSRLRSLRISEYRVQSQAVSVYGTPETVLGVGRETGDTRFPLEPADERQAETPGRAFVWQWDFWIVEDLARAIVRANTGDDGVLAGVPDAAVKRINAINISSVGLGETADAGSSGFPDDGGFDRESRSRGGAPSSSASDEEGLRSFTGRLDGSPDQVYDARVARLDVVVASARLPELVAAISSTNLMTVTAIETEPVDISEELKQGFYFGDDHVVRAVLEIETLWLRPWTAGLMPQSVADVLGVQRPQPAIEESLGG